MCSSSSALQKTSSGDVFNPAVDALPQAVAFMSESPMATTVTQEISHAAGYGQSSLIPFPSFNKDFMKTLGSHSRLHSIHFGDGEKWNSQEQTVPN